MNYRQRRDGWSGGGLVTGLLIGATVGLIVGVVIGPRLSEAARQAMDDVTAPEELDDLGSFSSSSFDEGVDRDDWSGV